MVNVNQLVEGRYTLVKLLSKSNPVNSINEYDIQNYLCKNPIKRVIGIRFQEGEGIVPIYSLTLNKEDESIGLNGKINKYRQYDFRTDNTTNVDNVPILSDDVDMWLTQDCPIIFNTSGIKFYFTKGEIVTNYLDRITYVKWYDDVNYGVAIDAVMNGKVAVSDKKFIFAVNRIVDGNEFLLIVEKDRIIQDQSYLKTPIRQHTANEEDQYSRWNICNEQALNLKNTDDMGGFVGDLEFCFDYKTVRR
ncbi:hypothetical protein V6O07_02190 [Arthrospira platensis SPKY2]